MCLSVFVSYSWGDSVMRTALIQHLDLIDNVQVLYDKKNIKFSAEIHPQISSLLDACDCVIFLLTRESLKSFEVWNEVIRAHERGKVILPIVKKDVDPSDIPYFLVDVNSVQFDEKSFDDALLNVSLFLKSIAANSQYVRGLSILKSIQSKLSNLDHSHPFQSKLVERIAIEADREIGKVLGEYSIDLGVERNFLYRARTIFESANSIFAVSVAKISTFWVNRDNRELAKEYINCQPPTTHRIFVFSTPEEAHYFRNVLHANYKGYGDTGGVYLCSLDEYKKIINKVFDGDGQGRYLLDTDFGVLDYGGFCIEAQLDSSKLMFKESISKKNSPVSLEKFEDLYADIVKEDGNAFNVARWQPEMMNDDDCWADQLNALFGGRSGYVYHFVFFTEEIDELEELVLEVKYEIEEMQERLKNIINIDSIWFGKSKPLEVEDGLFSGPLKVKDDYKYVLMIRFPDIENIEKYYKHRTHARIRKKLYSNFSSNIRFLYGEITRMRKAKIKKLTKNIEKIYAIIEALASDYMVRYDFFDEERIETIVRSNKVYDFE